MATATYRNPVTGGYEIRLIAFSTGGQVLGDQKVTTVVQTVSGGAECPLGFLCFGFEHGVLSLTVTSPGLGIFTFQGGGTPHIVVSDGLKDLVGYTFDGASFIERWRVHNDNYFLRSTPTILPDGHTIIGVEKIERKNGQEYGSGKGAMLFAGPNMNAVPRVDGIGRVFTAPSVTGDGRAILVSGDGELAVLQGAQVVSKTGITSGSIASAAVSRTHVFVSTYDAFLTYDVNNLAEVGRINWVGGGMSPPAIGPKGQVYAIAKNILFVFPGPKRVIDPGIVADPPQAVVTTDPPPSTQPASQHFSGPLTPGGYRLFACLELDGDDCGKSTNKQVALAFCQQKGFAQVDKVDTETKKVKAARLDGQFCTKNKCEVFDEIVCKN
ncbi:MAG TPA: hypothetical protein VFS85_06005 [Dongiaceae bacterium]|nr:hypothetical protein [Dongiaceae bacterium]